MPGTCPCIEALQEARCRHGKLRIVNSDTGSPFTSIDCIRTRKEAGTQIGQKRKRIWRDIVFVERLWRRIEIQRDHSVSSISKQRMSVDHRCSAFRKQADRARRGDAGRGDDDRPGIRRAPVLASPPDRGLPAPGGYCRSGVIASGDGCQRFNRIHDTWSVDICPTR